MKAEKFVTRLAEKAGITINGPHPFDIQVHNPLLYRRILQEGTPGFAEAYMDGWWDCEALDVMACKVLRAHLESDASRTMSVLTDMLLGVLNNPRNVRRARLAADAHYNFGNDMFECMLGPAMNYSCGYWANADNLDEAEMGNMELVAKKLMLKPGMKVLDIGCGFGSLALYLAAQCGVEVTGITLSAEQAAYARERVRGLPVEVLLQDYRSLSGSFDRVVSVGMFEHVGRKHYAVFMETVRRVLKKDGLFLLQTMGSNSRKRGMDAWVSKYVVPNSMLPSLSCMAKAVQGRFVMEDWHNFGADYDKTLMAWAKRFDEGRDNGCFTCDDADARLFRYYLLTCAGAFRARDIELWQIVLCPHGVEGGYSRP